ncbi:uncharacterized protein LOC116179140 [Photinus pyralis]|uniref:Uncharacterized protein n=1 Tax=Photinus pyralis TaxID=7054 RepID=A0A1Y1MER5_PHOPY|nr:uncharacterized protein LOC116179140 [Photinus pyralis]
MKANILCFVFIWCVVQVTSSEFPDELIEDYMRECMDELKLDKSVLSKMFDEKFRMVHVDEDGKKLLECGIKKGDLISADGKMNKIMLMKDIINTIRLLGKGDSEKMAEEVYKKCDEGNADDDHIERIRHWSNCVLDEIDKM